MSLAIKYESVEDARMRLKSTVVLYEGRPVLVTEVRESDKPDDIFRVTFKELPYKPDKPFDPRVAEDAEGVKRKYISSKHFDIAPFKLGYVNSKGGAFYCTRLPNRVQKQGLCSDNFKAYYNGGGAVSWGTFCSCDETPAMVAGNYPTFDKALKLLGGKTPSIAFSRDFAVSQDEVIPDLIFLYHKGVKVGMFTKGSVTLGVKFTCLKESLMEMRVQVG